MNIPLKILVILNLFSLPIFGQANCDSLLTVLYDFSNGPIDLSGNGHDGTIQGNIFFNGQLDVPEDTARAVIVPSETINGALDFTVTMRVKIDLFHLEETVHGWQPINHFISGFLDNNAFNLGYSKPKNSILFSFDGVYLEIPLSTELMEGHWHCMGISRKGGFMQVYVDGENISGQIEVPNLPVNIAENGFVLAQDQDCLSGCYEFHHSLAGSIDNFRIYRRALAEIEFTAICQKTFLEINLCPGENYFGHIQPGIYADNFIGQYGCDSIRVVDLRKSELEFISIETLPTECQIDSGLIHVVAGNGVGDIGYALQNSVFQTHGFFGNLFAGEYLLTIKDSFGCEISQNIEVEEINDLYFEKVVLERPYCYENNGKVIFEGKGGELPYSYFLENIKSENGFFENIEQGEYMIKFKDHHGCSIDSLVFLEKLKCPIYIPNVFSPNGDGINDKFQIFTEPDFNGTIDLIKILDRWGNVVYEQRHIDPKIFANWWDGTIKDEKANPGIYLYQIIWNDGETVQSINADVMLM